MSEKDLLRMSQVITTFGPGAMLDLPSHSVIVAGLDDWSRNNRRRIHEERLLRKLRQSLDRPELELYTPPAFDDQPNAKFAAIAARVFPTWYIVQDAQPTGPKGQFRRRRLVRWPLDRGKFRDPNDNKRKSVVPVRFVCGCEKGHLDDLDFNAFLHGQTAANHEMWLEERGTSGDIGETYVGCSCGITPRSLYEAAAAGALGTCPGKRPWLGQFAAEGCGRPYRLLVRTASNAYFPQVMSVISLPEEDSEIAEKIGQVWDDYLKGVDDEDDLRFYRKKNPKVTVALEGLSDAEVMKEIARRKGAAASQAPPKVRSAEFPILNSGKARIGKDEPGSDFYAETLPRADWDPHSSPLLRPICNLVLVHRLREVMALIGFTRFEARSADVEGEYDLGVEPARLALEASWLPAVENRGEGIFLSLRPEEVEHWLKRDAVKARGRILEAGYNVWAHSRKVTQPWLKLHYVLLHSLSHLLLTALALDCGYPASSLRERIYAGDRAYGILIYTGSSDAEGTLGGLVQAGRRIERHLTEALKLATLCSNDPVCSEHRPDNDENERPLHGAACHGCVLIAETSCEQRNDFLDRALVVPTVGEPNAAFFDAPRIV